MQGKEKIKRELEKSVINVSVSTVGRVLKYLMDKGTIHPPRSPKMNCYVERANETYRYKFWHVYEIPDTIEETRKLLRKFEYKYNCERMPQSLNYLTLMEYNYKLKDKFA